MQDPHHPQSGASITTNRAFKEWGEVVAIEGESYRPKEAKARAELRAAQRRSVRAKAGRA